MSAFVDARKVGAGGQNEGEGAGKVALEEFEGIVIDARVGAGLGEVMTDDGELALLRVDALDAANALHGADVEGVATDGIERVGGIDDKSTVTQGAGDAIQILLVGVVGVNF